MINKTEIKFKLKKPPQLLTLKTEQDYNNISMKLQAYTFWVYI
jgi:hypothetical protein